MKAYNLIIIVKKSNVFAKGLSSTLKTNLQ